ncbi:MAG: hypothetical protein ACKOF9_09630 [Burkholderiales bacterium]
MLKRSLLIVLWPAFLMAGVLEILVFALVNPSDLHSLSGQALLWSDQAIYTVSFLVFWAIISAAGGMTWLLHQTNEAINTKSFR